MTTEFFNNHYKFGLDWLNGVLPCEDISNVFDTLELFSSKLKRSRWELANTGKYNYSCRYLLDGSATVQLMYNPVVPGSNIVDNNHNNPGVFFSISGDGIRYLCSLGGEQSAFEKLMFYFHGNGFKATRFDVYCDILDENNKIVPLLKKSFQYFLCPRVSFPTLSTDLHRNRNNVSLRYSYDDSGKRFYNLQLGNHGSNFGMFRCYNKLVEVSDGRLSHFKDKIFSEYDVSDYWYRLEYEIHKDFASQCFNISMENAYDNNLKFDFRQIFFTCAKRMFKPVVFEAVSKSHIANLEICSIWVDFLELVGQNIHFVEFAPVVFVPFSVRNLSRQMERNKSYFYAQYLMLQRMTPLERLSYIERARESFNDKSRYNPLRDELAL